MFRFKKMKTKKYQEYRKKYFKKKGGKSEKT
jgi:hypothetical protein